MKRPKSSEGTMVMPVPAYVEGTDSLYASEARIALMFSTQNPESSKGYSSVLHSSNGKVQSPRGAGISFRDAYEKMLTISSARWGSRRWHLFLIRVPLVCAYAAASV